MIVRLKVCPLAMLRNHRTSFHFYDSPIKSPCVLENPECYSSFISMIVRLKAEKYLCYFITDLSFISMIVRLKDHLHEFRPHHREFHFYDSPIKSPYIVINLLRGQLFHFYDSPIKSSAFSHHEEFVL